MFAKHDAAERVTCKGSDDPIDDEEPWAGWAVARLTGEFYKLQIASPEVMPHNKPQSRLRKKESNETMADTIYELYHSFVII